MAYSEKVIDHYQHPRNVGTLDPNDPSVGTGLVGAPECGDVMRLHLKIDPETGVIQDAKFKTFGCGSAIAQTIETASTSAPDQRSGVRNSPIRTRPQLAAIKGPVPNAAMRPIAPGRRATHSVTTIIQSMPIPISHQKKPSRPKGIAAMIAVASRAFFM